MVDELREVCEREGQKLQNDWNGSWEAMGRGIKVSYTVSVVEDMLHGLCWNCEQVECTNCREEGMPSFREAVGSGDQSTE